MDKDIRDGLHKELVKLADILETCEQGTSEWRTYQREYRKVAKILYPEMYSKKTLRRPASSFIRTITKCTCGAHVIKLRKIEGNWQFSCKDCDRHSEICETQPLARDSWNKTFEEWKHTKQLNLE